MTEFARQRALYTANVGLADGSTVAIIAGEVHGTDEAVVAERPELFIDWDATPRQIAAQIEQNYHATLHLVPPE
jgi:hypothetical protein